MFHADLAFMVLLSGESILLLILCCITGDNINFKFLTAERMNYYDLSVSCVVCISVSLVSEAEAGILANITGPLALALVSAS
jgi:hypothetical protein